MINTISTVIAGVSENSGTILSTLSLASFTGYFINVLWSIQMTSFYAFLNISKPKVLDMFLNTTIVLQ